VTTLQHIPTEDIFQPSTDKTEGLQETWLTFPSNDGGFFVSFIVGDLETEIPQISQEI